MPGPMGHLLAADRTDEVRVPDGELVSGTGHADMEHLGLTPRACAVRRVPRNAAGRHTPSVLVP